MQHSKPYGRARVEPRPGAVPPVASVPALDELLAHAAPAGDGLTRQTLGAFEMSGSRPAAASPTVDDTVPAPQAAITDSARGPTAAPARSGSAWARAAGALVVTTVMALAYTQARDATQVAQALARYTSGQPVLICLNGHMHYPEPGLWPRLSGQGVFSCTDWRQSPEFGELTLR